MVTIRSIRENKGYTRTVLSVMAGVSERTIAQIENCAHMPSVAVADKLSIALEISPNVFMDLVRMARQNGSALGHKDGVGTGSAQT